MWKIRFGSWSSVWQEKSWLEMHFHQKWKWRWFKPVGWERNFLHYLNVISEGQVTTRRCELCKRLLSITWSSFHSCSLLEPFIMWSLPRKLLKALKYCTWNKNKNLFRHMHFYKIKKIRNIKTNYLCVPQPIKKFYIIVVEKLVTTY